MRDMQKKFSLNLLFLLGLNVLIKPVYLFGIEVGVQNEVGQAEYGLYYAMFNFTFLFNVILDMGMNNFQKIKVAQDSSGGMRNMATLVPLKLGLSLAYVAVTVVAALVMGFGERYWFFIGWIMLNQVLSAFLLLLRANLSGLHLFVRDSILSVTDRLLLILGIGYVLFFGAEPFQIEWFVLFQTGAYALAIVFALFLLPSGARFPQLNFSWNDAILMIRQTWPYALLILLMTAYSKLDGVMLERLAPHGLIEAGIYAQAYRILDAGNNFAFLYAGLLLPMFARLMRENVEGIAPLVNQGSRLLIVPAGMVFIVCFFHAEWLMDLLYHEAAGPSSKSLRWLMGSFVFISSGYVFGTLITASGKMQWLNLTAFFAVLLNVGLNFWLIPEYGAEGAAQASFYSLVAMALAQVVIVYGWKEFMVHGSLFNQKGEKAGMLAWLPNGLAVLTVVLISGWLLRWLAVPHLWAIVTLSLLSVILFLVFVLKRDDFSDALSSHSER